jgi:DHA1 family multidrug resistance protein-like MFS transporter
VPCWGHWPADLLADSYGLRCLYHRQRAVPVLYRHPALYPGKLHACEKEMLHAREVLTSLKNPRLVLSLFVTTLIIQVATGSIAPILTLYVRDLAGNVSNIAFISGLIASVPGVAAA